MSESNVRKCLNGLKIKNCEGVDRVPLRILNDGAQYLSGPITSLLNVIYKTRRIPDQWRQAKIIPTHKKKFQTYILNPLLNMAFFKF